MCIVSVLDLKCTVALYLFSLSKFSVLRCINLSTLFFWRDTNALKVSWILKSHQYKLEIGLPIIAL